jgi:hypothetical protein
MSELNSPSKFRGVSASGLNDWVAANDADGFPMDGDADLRDAAPEPETFYCPAQTFAGRRYIDPEPPEYCETEVENEGEYCPAHEEQDDYNPWGDD